MFKDFVTLFTGMKAVTSVMLIVGLILCIVKIFQPGQRTFGYLGATFLVLGVVFRMVNGGNSSHLFWLSFICCTILITSYIISVVTNRSGWFVKMKEEDEKMLMENLKLEPVYNFSLSDLSNRNCISVTELLPDGTIKIDNNYYVAVSLNGFIPKNKKLVVEKVENNIIFVREEGTQC